MLTGTRAAGLLEMDAIGKFALFAGIKGFHRTMIPHHAGIDGALGAFGMVFFQDFFV